jgi:hypothetical protein
MLTPQESRSRTIFTLCRACSETWLSRDNNIKTDSGVWQVFVEELREIQAQYFSWQISLLYTWTVPCDGWQCRSQWASYANIGNVTSNICQMQEWPFIFVDALTQMSFASWLGGLWIYEWTAWCLDVVSLWCDAAPDHTHYSFRL